MDAQDNQDGTLLHARLTPAMIVCGFADVQDCKAAVSRKILCIHVNKNRPVLDFEPVCRFAATRRKGLVRIFAFVTA